MHGGGGGLILPQLNVPGFVDSLFKALFFLKSLWGVGLGRGEGESRRWEGVGTGLVYKMNRKLKKILKKSFFCFYRHLVSKSCLPGVSLVISIYNNCIG